VVVIDGRQEPPVNWWKWNGFRPWHRVSRQFRHDWLLRKVWPMFRRLSMVALMVLSAVSSLAATEPNPDKTKQITNSIGMKLTLVPSGEFMMGSAESAEATAAFFNRTYGEEILTADLFKDEHPQHRVRITKPFYLGTYHITRGQFRQFVKESGYKTDAEKGDKPGAWGWDSNWAAPL